MPVRSLDVSFIVPCFNEEKNVAAVIDVIESTIRPLNLTYEILVYNDASTDQTGAVVEKILNTRPDAPIRLFTNEKNMGLGGNYFLGSKQAKGKHYMLVNGDNDVPPELLRLVLQQMGRYDMIVPFLGFDRRGFFRRNLSRLFTTIVQILSGTRLRYYNCVVLHQTDNVSAWDAKTAGYGYQAELLCHLVREGKTYMQVEVPHELRENGTTKAFRPSNFVAVGQSLGRIFKHRLTHKPTKQLAARH